MEKTMLQKSKSLILKILKMYGYELVKINPDWQSDRTLPSNTSSNHKTSDRNDELWLNYTKYDAPDEQETLEKYLEWIADCQTIYLLGYTDLTKLLIPQIHELYSDKKVYIVEQKTNSTEIERTEYSSLFLSLPNALSSHPDCWVLCDLKHGYKDYKLLRDRGFHNIFHRSIFHRSPWKMSDFYPELLPSLDRMPETMLDNARLLTLAECVRYCSRLEGEFLEIGTYRGGSGFLICQVLENIGIEKKVNLIDWYEQQSSEVDFDRVREIFASFPFTNLMSGKAEEIVPNQEATPLSFIHIDVNGDETIIEKVLPVLYQRLVKSGMILFDNYYFRFFCKYNFDKFASSVNEKIILLPSIPQGILIKSQD
jgi:hypothetical protein